VDVATSLAGHLNYLMTPVGTSSRDDEEEEEEEEEDEEDDEVARRQRRRQRQKDRDRQRAAADGLSDGRFTWTETEGDVAHSVISVVATVTGRYQADTAEWTQPQDATLTPPRGPPADHGVTSVPRSPRWSPTLDGYAQCTQHGCGGSFGTDA